MTQAAVSKSLIRPYGLHAFLSILLALFLDFCGCLTSRLSFKLAPAAVNWQEAADKARYLLNVFA
jgi:hypothetical protein